MKYDCLYPVNLNLGSKRCLIIGFGKVGKRKLAGLLNGGACDILLLDCDENAWHGLDFQDQRIKYATRSYTEADIKNSFIVFAATNSSTVNKSIASLCASCHVLCNSATAPETGDFFVPAVVREKSVMATISTYGQSPALTHNWKEELAAWLRLKSRQSWLLGRLRAPLLALGYGQAENGAIFQSLSARELEQLLNNGNPEQIADWLLAKLPASLHKEILIILEEYRHAFS